MRSVKLNSSDLTFESSAFMHNMTTFRFDIDLFRCELNQLVICHQLIALAAFLHLDIQRMF